MTNHITPILQDLDFISSDEGGNDDQHHRFRKNRQPHPSTTSSTPPSQSSSNPYLNAANRSSVASLPQYASCTDLDLTEDEEDEEQQSRAGGGSGGGSKKSGPPPPGQLTLEGQQNRSVVIGWRAPESSQRSRVEAYQVVVDGALHSTVPASRGDKEEEDEVDDQVWNSP